MLAQRGGSLAGYLEPLKKWYCLKQKNKHTNKNKLKGKLSTLSPPDFEVTKE